MTCSAGKGFVRAYPFDNGNPSSPKRTKEGDLKMHSAVSQGEPVEGVKGPSWFLYFTYFDIIRGFCIDWMHGVLLGVVLNVVEPLVLSKQSWKVLVLW